MNRVEDTVEELNQLLKGTHMGIFIFEDLSEKLFEEIYKKEFERVLILLYEHKKMLSNHIKVSGAIPIDTVGFMGTMSEIISKVKNLSITTDFEVLEEAIKSIEMGLKALRVFNDKHLALNNIMRNEISIMKDDYSSIYHSLHKFLLSRT